MCKKLLLLFLLLSACTVRENKGYYFANKEMVENFDVYNFTKQDVASNLGLPTKELNHDTWLYYSYKTENYNFLKPKLKEEDILIVYFDENDNIENFSLMTKKDTKELLKIKDVSGNKNKGNIFKQLFEGLTFTPAM